MNKNRSSHAALIASVLAAAGMSAVIAPSNDAPSAVQARMQESGVRGGGMAETQTPQLFRTSLSRLGEQFALARAMFGGSDRSKRFPNGPGWTQAHVQRMARKRRNKIRNRKAHR